MEQKDPSRGRGVTLNDLLDEQHALNMRMLLAVQLRDPEVQAELKAELEDVARRIGRMLSGGSRDQDLPQ